LATATFIAGKTIEKYICLLVFVFFKNISIRRKVCQQTKEVISRRKSKDRQLKSQQKKEQRNKQLSTKYYEEHEPN
jgi:hypothetical protein